MKYKIVMNLFIASTKIIEENLSKEEAESKCKQYNKEEAEIGDMGYRWYTVEKQ